MEILTNINVCVSIIAAMFFLYSSKEFRKILTQLCSTVKRLTSLLSFHYKAMRFRISEKPFVNVFISFVALFLLCGVGFCGIMTITESFFYNSSYDTLTWSLGTFTFMIAFILCIVPMNFIRDLED